MFPPPLSEPREGRRMPGGVHWPAWREEGAPGPRLLSGYQVDGCTSPNSEAGQPVPSTAVARGHTRHGPGRQDAAALSASPPTGRHEIPSRRLTFPPAGASGWSAGLGRRPIDRPRAAIM
ncbi:unnamed protein product [Diplocarpon coronariae]|uniref:Uncharacterized protein n=1 Tax=Diplocarpon coronariae TaxID=2795749 RepID=A0A218Z865_9HELO|nr:hypothetical protein B2J93_6076 [Marssonina coronariae]